MNTKLTGDDNGNVFVKETPAPKSETLPTRQAKLTPEQIANWKKAFPIFAFMSDEQVQSMRNNLQSQFTNDELSQAE